LLPTEMPDCVFCVIVCDNCGEYRARVRTTEDLPRVCRWCTSEDWQLITTSHGWSTLEMPYFTRPMRFTITGGQQEKSDWPNARTSRGGRPPKAKGAGA
jgi:hypothetical protein